MPFTHSEIAGRAGCHRFEFRSPEAIDRVSAGRAIRLALAENGGISSTGGGGGLLYWEVCLRKGATPEAVVEGAAGIMERMGPVGVYLATNRGSSGWENLGHKSSREDVLSWMRGAYRNSGASSVIGKAQAASDVFVRNVRIDKLGDSGSFTAERAAISSIIAKIISGGGRIEPIVVEGGTPMNIVDGRLRAAGAKMAGRKTVCAIVLSS